LIKRVEINYRGIFQKNLGKKIGSDIVIIASGMGRIGFSNGRYSDSPERNGIPCKYFAFVSHDLSEEELEAECGAKLDIDQCDISVVLDDTMIKGVEPWGWHGVRPINEKVQPGGTLLVVTKKSQDELLQFIAKKNLIAGSSLLIQAISVLAVFGFSGMTSRTRKPLAPSPASIRTSSGLRLSKNI